jgi:kynurenine 3-monooxygenase
MQSTSSNTTFTIKGAGPVGLSAALLLQKQGFGITVSEKRDDPRTRNERGRSINLALSDRGFRTLGLLGLEEKIKEELAIPMQGRMIHDPEGNTKLQPYSTEGKTIFSVSRNALNHLLLDETEKKGINIHFQQKTSGFDFGRKTLLLENGEELALTEKEVLLGCDGAFSAIRQSMKALPNFSHQETKLDYAYKELSIPALNNTWAMHKNALHIWPRKSFMLIALPNVDGTFTCTLFLAEKGDENSFESLQNSSQARHFFAQHFPDALDMMPYFEGEWEVNPVSSLYMETCSPWNVGKNTLLLGDAAHAIVPFYGQGLNAGLEDVRLFSEAITNGSTLHEFQAKRKPDADAIGQLALRNFIEMRDLVTDPAFLTKSKLETKLKALYHDKWQTLYEMVTFSHLPYSSALQKGQDNQKKLNIILENELLTEHLLHDQVTEQDMYLLSLIVL